MTENNGIPPMVNFDSGVNIPGSISAEERKQQELQKLNEKNQDRPQQIVQNEVGHRLEDPEAQRDPPPVSDGKPKEEVRSAPPEVAHDAVPIPKVEAPNGLSHSLDTINDALQTAKQPTVIEKPDQFTTTEDAEVIPENEKGVVQSFIPGEESDTSVPPQNVDDATTKPNTPPIESQPVTDTPPPPAPPVSENPPTAEAPQANTQEAAQNVELSWRETNISDNIMTQTVEDTEVKKADANKDIPLENVNDKAEPGTYVESITEEEANKRQLEELEKDNNGYLTTSKQLNDVQVIELNDYTTTHYKIFEASTAEIKKLQGKEIDISKRTVVEASTIPDYMMRQVELEQNILDGLRKVQIVAVQSGYSCMVKPFNSRELRTFGRREGNDNTYAYEMAICNAIYSKLSEFSCGALTFQQWMNATAYSDLQTFMFGLYHATYPSKTPFTFDCNFCGKNISVQIDTNTLACIPPGSIAQQQISDILNNPMAWDPKRIQALTQRWSALDIFIEKGRRFFRARTPSIFEFLENSFKGKKEEVVNDFYHDMIYAGYIRGVGIIDIKHYNQTGEANYFLDTRVEAIDKAIADISPDEKKQFEKEIINYITRFSVAYQIPRVKCKHCGRIINQRDINTRTLFFETKSRKGF